MDNTEYSHIVKTMIAGLFVVLYVAGASINLSFGSARLPLEFFFLTLAALFLDTFYSAFSVVIFMIIGLVGVPVFGFKGGLTSFLNPNFGYVLAGVCFAAICSSISHRAANPSYKRLFSAMFIALAVFHLIGFVYLFVIKAYFLGNASTIPRAFLESVLPAFPFYVICCVVSVITYKALYPALVKYNLI